MLPPDVVILKLPTYAEAPVGKPDGAEAPAGEPDHAPEYFVMIDRADLFPSLAPGAVASREQWLEHFALLLKQPRLTAHEVRAALGRRGVAAEQVEAQIAAARRRFEVMTSKPATWGAIRQIGFRNPEGQQIVRKTDEGGPEGQRIFVLRCTVCGHEYGAYGIDADVRRCPRCQDGPPGLPIPG